MTCFAYDHLDFAVRQDLLQAYREFWRRLAQPGSWWDGAERVAIAQEVRNATSCSYCKSRKAALSPYNLPGEHEHSGRLSEAAVDAVHRVITDQGRITQQWVDDNSAAGLSEEHYVELIAVAVTVFSIDEFNRGIGAPLEPLPSPEPGKPDHYRPAQAVHDTGFVSMLPAKGSYSGREGGLWPKGRSANVMRALSLVPDGVRQWQAVAGAQYLPAEQIIQMSPDSPRAIDRMQIELVAARVSAINECFY